MDGPISYTNSTTGNTITLRAGDYPTPQPQDPYFFGGSSSITGYTAYWEDQYALRMVTEQCDNGGDEDHGCDSMCQIEDGWECFHYYHHILPEEPFFTSICQEVDYPTLSRRRLSPDDFDRKGRLLHHLPRKAYVYRLPDNYSEMRPDKHTLYFNEKKGLNGQVRVVDSKDCTTCYGFTMAYERDEYTDPDWWYFNVRISTTGSTSNSEASTDLASGVLQGKQRNTFGPYMVFNSDMDNIEVQGYTASGTDASWSSLWISPDEASIEYVGSHEFYWFPYASLLMGKLSDGSSFRLFRMASNFRDVASGGDGAFETKDKIDSGEFRLFHVPGRTMVPPVFYERMAYFYLSGTTSTSTAKLVAYKWNILTNEFEEKCSADIGVEGASTNIYHKFSLVNTGADGVVFIAYGLTTPTLYLCSDSSGSWTMTDTTVTWDNDAAALTGAQEDTSTTSYDEAQIVLVQPRENPDDYVSGTIPPIYALYGSGYIQKLTWTSPNFAFTSPSIVVPVDHLIVVQAQHFDAGHHQLVLLSPSNCDAFDGATTDTGTIIIGSAVYFYSVATEVWDCWDLTTLASTMDRYNADDGITDDYWEHMAY